MPNVQLDDIQAILNMRDAWRHILKTVETPIDLAYMCTLNGFITRNEALEWGRLRTGRVGISGTDYIPPIPRYDEVEQEIHAILNSDTTATEKALIAFAWGSRGQFFWDGNKKTSLTLANIILVMSGAGMLTITDRKSTLHKEPADTIECSTGFFHRLVNKTTKIFYIIPYI